MATLKDTDVFQNLSISGNLVVDGKVEVNNGNLNAASASLTTDNTINCPILQAQNIASISGYKVPVVLSSGTFHPAGTTTTISSGGIYLPSTGFVVPTTMDLYVHVNITNRPNRNENQYIYYDIQINNSTILTGNAGNSSAASHIRSLNLSGFRANNPPGNYTVRGISFIASGTLRLGMGGSEGPGVQYYILGIPV